jgi:fucose 4-O-acetylase-like acetyltransferase
METKERSVYWDLIKGLGIIAIVVGHSCSPLGPFVYMYHLMLFFFISGYLYNDKYSFDIYGFIGKRVQSQWSLTVKYSLLFVLLHNLFVGIGIYSPINFPYYDYRSFIAAIINNILLQGGEQMGGALWFIPLLFFSSIGFCFIRSLTRNIENNRRREIINSFLIIIIGYLGVFFINRQLYFVYHAHLCFLIIPILQVGFLLKQYRVNIPYKWYYAVLSVVIILLVLFLTGKNVELSRNEIIGYQYFYLVSLCGIYANLYLGKVLMKHTKVTNVLSYLGNKSFHIMALHFIFFKPVEYFRYFVQHKPFSVISSFPVSSKAYWIAYIILGVSLPALTVYYGEKLLAKLKTLITAKAACFNNAEGTKK